MDKVNKIMHLVMDLTDDDFKETLDLIASQASYNNPLRMEKTTRIRSIGKHNKRMLDQLEILRDIVNDIEGEYE